MLNDQRKLVNLFQNSCLAMSYAYIANISQIPIFVLTGNDKGFIENDGYVRYPVKYLALCGVYVRDIEKVPIKSLNELPKEGMFVVEYKIEPNAKQSHFVVATSEMVVYDPTEDSSTVKYGAPVSYRKLIK